VCSTEVGGYASGSVATGSVMQAGQVSSEEPCKVSHYKGVGRVPQVFANHPRGGVHIPKSKPGPPG
jgi:hypothetical protein